MAEIVTTLRALTPASPAPVDGGGIVTAPQVHLAAPGRVTGFYQHGWHSFSATGWVEPAAPPEPLPIPALRLVADDPAHAGADAPNGAGVGAVHDDNGEVLLLGALGLEARVHLIGDELVGRTEHGIEIPWFVGRGASDEVFAAYARQLGEHLGRRRVSSPRLWSSWYSYYEQITEHELREVLATVRSWPVDAFQVDDGWQRAVGDWQANDSFPTGMADLAARIRKAGLRPGLWIAPFIASPSSTVFQQRPDWFVAGEDGQPLPVGYNWGAWYYALDLSRSEVLDHVAQVIVTACDWGYELLKLDFLFAGAVPGARQVDGPREAGYRAAVECIREAAGDDAYLLACGAPILPSLGVFDAIRISNDVSPYWDNPVLTEVVGATSEVATRGAIATSLHRLWLAEVIATDPDVVFFRARGNLMDDEQRRHLQDLAVIAGFRGTSDPPSWLDDAEREQLVAYFASVTRVEQLGAYRFSLDGRVVDFSPLAQRAPVVGSRSGPWIRTR